MDYDADGFIVVFAVGCGFSSIYAYGYGDDKYDQIQSALINQGTLESSKCRLSHMDNSVQHKS